VKEGIGNFASVSAAFSPAGSIHLGNPGFDDFRVLPDSREERL
jgi:hypothetical protein